MSKFLLIGLVVLLTCSASRGDEFAFMKNRIDRVETDVAALKQEIAVIKAKVEGVPQAMAPTVGSTLAKSRTEFASPENANYDAFLAGVLSGSPTSRTLVVGNVGATKEGCVVPAGFGGKPDGTYHCYLDASGRPWMQPVGKACPAGTCCVAGQCGVAGCTGGNCATGCGSPSAPVVSGYYSPFGGSYPTTTGCSGGSCASGNCSRR